MPRKVSCCWDLMVDMLVKDGLIVTMDRDRRVIAGGSIEIEDGRMVSIGRGKEVGREKPDQVINARGKIVMPGIVCSHTHLHGTFFRAAPLKVEHPADFVQILRNVRWPIEEEMTRDDAYVSALSSCLHFIKTGTTFFADTFSGQNAITGVLDRIAAAIRRSGIRGIIAFEATERRTHAEGAKGTRENERFIRKVKKERVPKVRGMFGIHAPFTVSDELLHYVRELASRYEAPITIHASESLADLYHSYEHFGKRPIDRLKDAGLLGHDTIPVHCVHASEEELEILKKTGAKVAHTPMSNMLNGVGVAPVVRMLSIGIPVGLGDDGCTPDGFENLRTAFLLHKLALRDPRVISPQEVLEMATVKGAELYGLQEELGSLEPGKLADLIIVNPALAPTPLRPETVVGHLVHNTSGGDVETVIVGGRVVMNERKVMALDEAEVVKAARQSVEKLWQKLGVIGR